MSRLRIALPLCFLLFLGSALAADLPSWNDDSALTVTPYPRSFAPAIESANLVARVYHEVDSRATVAWRITVTDGDGKLVRTFTARQTYQPGEARQFSPAWNGTDEVGGVL